MFIKSEVFILLCKRELEQKSGGIKMALEAETLYKLIIMHMLNKVEFPLTNSQISQFSLENEYTNYFTVQNR